MLERTFDRRLAPLPCLLAALLLAGAPGVCAPADGPRLAIKGTAEVAVVATSPDGRESVKLTPADRVVPGDQVIYTVEIRNKTAMALPPPRVDYRIPEHLRYVEDSASGPGADVTFSVDGGHRFDRPENLTVLGTDGRRHLATAADYTHIRWQLKNILKGHAVAFARFRAIVK